MKNLLFCLCLLILAQSAYARRVRVDVNIPNGGYQAYIYIANNSRYEMLYCDVDLVAYKTDGGRRFARAHGISIRPGDRLEVDVWSNDYPFVNGDAWVDCN